jgi:hypothetical protein
MARDFSDTQVHAKAPTSTSSREQTIQWLLSDEGTRWYGERIPRWKAEQIVAPCGVFDRTQKRVDWDLKRQRQLSKELHGHGPVGQAFDAVCRAGCDADWLERALLTLARYPLERGHKVYGAKDKRRLTRVIRKIESAARELQRFGTLMLLSTVKEWPAPPQELPAFLGGIAYCLRESLASPEKWAQVRQMTAADRLPYLIDVVRRSTGKPRYAHMATLIGAAYGETDFDETSLKMRISRRRRRSR